MLALLDPNDPYAFPPVEAALREPNGLLAVGGDLSPARLLAAYRRGIFPWYNRGEPILWWSPDPRLVLFPEKLKIARSLRKVVKKGAFQVTFDQAFARVIDACAAPRKRDQGTWITPEMKVAYCRLHALGYAHSVEAWDRSELVGGLYGVAIGCVFFGESMFYRRTDASKVAFVALVEHLTRWQYGLIDCQVRTEHLLRLGAEEIPRRDFIRLLDELCSKPCAKTAWRCNLR
nr:leucyl/phenylalanyl-tRNA--protein transferase [uncultured Gammaproteobacteria bacterium]BAL53136.1 leucyl/phenylalanyl-tRNA--protein transferase [uncultured Gammaproteobacteria bacterium]